MLRVALRLAGAALLLTPGLSCDPKETDYFLTAEDVRRIGNLVGLISSGTTPLNASVALTGPESRTMTTGTTGMYSFLDLTPGNYTVTPTVAGFNCPSGNATVIEFQTTTLNLTCTPQVGTIDGTIRLDLQVQSDIPVAARQGTNTVGSATTGANGKFTIPNLLPGPYTVLMTLRVNWVCPTTQRDVTVQANATVTADFDCTSAPGSVTGFVFVDMVGRSGVTVTLTQGGTTIGTATTGASGTYAIANVQPGAYTVTITPPSGTVCTTASQNVTVQSNQTATANFDCTTPPSSDFTVTLSEPPPSYRHIVPGVSSETCTGVTTSPAKPGGTWTTMWTGPGTVGATQRSGTLDASGKAADRQPINQFGTYNVNVQVTAGGATRSGTGSVNVQSGAGTCPAPAP